MALARMVGRPFNSKMWCVAAMLSKLSVLSNKDVGLSHTHFSHEDDVTLATNSTHVTRYRGRSSVLQLLISEIWDQGTGAQLWMVE
jgi:hypothetical protein